MPHFNDHELVELVGQFMTLAQTPAKSQPAHYNFVPPASTKALGPKEKMRVHWDSILFYIHIICFKYLGSVTVLYMVFKNT